MNNCLQLTVDSKVVLPSLTVVKILAFFVVHVLYVNCVGHILFV